MGEFKGFPEGEVHFTPIPDLFIEHLLPLFDHLETLKVALYIFYRFEHLEGSFRFLRKIDLLKDKKLLLTLHEDSVQAELLLKESLEVLKGHGMVLEAIIDFDANEEICYFLNSPRGRAALRAINSGQWRPTLKVQGDPFPDHPNVFQLYEENIGPITPLIAESLAEVEDTYPTQWIEEAFIIAVEKNKRNLRYISAILERWRKEGYHGKKGTHKDRRDTEETRRRYIEGEYSDFIER